MLAFHTEAEVISKLELGEYFPSILPESIFTETMWGAYSEEMVANVKLIHLAVRQMLEKNKNLKAKYSGTARQYGSAEHIQIQLTDKKALDIHIANFSSDMADCHEFEFAPISQVVENSKHLAIMKVDHEVPSTYPGTTYNNTNILSALDFIHYISTRLTGEGMKAVDRSYGKTLEFKMGTATNTSSGISIQVKLGNSIKRGLVSPL